MNKKKLNCWEFHKCGREPGGEKAEKYGVCPVATETRLDNVHEGTNAGRSCWIVIGTFCKDRRQSTPAEKYSSCLECEFYNKVREDEGPGFVMAPVLLKKIRP